ncbi:hypothetical protein V6N13_061941 [Hibiscus sabdariffa]|uniref:Uncharacterized protein n=2 Tax=Hibiscus sabdariffa TaxID=183260 RepID=A0ABR2PEV9_9ROSI
MVHLPLHREAVDSFIPRKRRVGGVRFGFVRFTGMEEALRAQDRLHGFVIYDFSIRVHMEIHQSRRVHGKISEVSRIQAKPAVGTSVEENQTKIWIVIGVVDLGKLKICETCLVGWSHRFMKVRRLALMLHVEGMKEVSVLSPVGSTFMLI